MNVLTSGGRARRAAAVAVAGCLAAVLAALLSGPAAAQFVPAPNAPAIPRGPMALFIDPHTQVALEFLVLDCAPGVYDQVSVLPDHRPAPADQVYAGLVKSGATVALSQHLITASGVQAAISASVPIPYQATVNGQTKTLNVNIGTTVAATPQIMANGDVALAIKYSRIDLASASTPGEPPATHTVSFSAWRELRPGESALLGVIKPIPGYGTQKEEVIFVRILSVKHT